MTFGRGPNGLHAIPPSPLERCYRRPPLTTIRWRPRMPFTWASADNAPSVHSLHLTTPASRRRRGDPHQSWYGSSSHSSSAGRSFGQFGNASTVVRHADGGPARGGGCG